MIVIRLNLPAQKRSSDVESQRGPGRQVEVQVAVQKKGFSTYAFELEIHLHLDPMDVSSPFCYFAQSKTSNTR